MSEKTNTNTSFLKTSPPALSADKCFLLHVWITSYNPIELISMASTIIMINMICTCIFVLKYRCGELIRQQFSRLTHPPWTNGRHYADDVFKSMFLNESAWILAQISLNVVPMGLIHSRWALVQEMAWRRTGASHYLNRCVSSFLTHICGTSGRCVKGRLLP